MSLKEINDFGVLYSNIKEPDTELAEDILATIIIDMIREGYSAEATMSYLDELFKTEIGMRNALPQLPVWDFSFSSSLFLSEITSSLLRTFFFKLVFFLNDQLGPCNSFKITSSFPLNSSLNVLYSLLTFKS